MSEHTKYFFLTGLPRSRTGWLANLLTYGDSFCYHEVLHTGNHVEAITQKLSEAPASVVGVAEPSLLLHWQELRDRYPEARWVVVERSPGDSLDSFRKAMPGRSIASVDQFQSQIVPLKSSMNGQCLCVAYDDLENFSTCWEIVKWCTGETLSRQRWELLHNLRVTQAVDKIEAQVTSAKHTGDGFIRVETIRTAEQMEALRKVAPPGHPLLYPTHLILLGGEIAGSMSVCSIPVLSIWTSDKLNARKTFEAINIGKNLGRAASNGRPLVCTCSPKSPLHPYVTQVGFDLAGNTDIYLENGRQ